MAGERSVTTWYVLASSGGLLLTKYAEYGTRAEAVAVVQGIMRAGWCPLAWVAYAVRGEGHTDGLVFVETYSDGRLIDNTTAYLQAQSVPLVLPPPSPADDLGEEV